MLCGLLWMSWVWITSVNEGDGAFYGPKIDFHLEDSHGKNLAVRYHSA